MHIHVHTHTYIHSYRHTHTHTHRRSRQCTRTHRSSRQCTRTRTHTHKDTHAHIHRRAGNTKSTCDTSIEVYNLPVKHSGERESVHFYIWERDYLTIRWLLDESCRTYKWGLVGALFWGGRIRHDLVTWLIRVCAMTHSYVWYNTAASGRATLRELVYMCDMTHLYVWHDSFICVTWFIYMCDMTHLYVWHDSVASGRATSSGCGRNPSPLLGVCFNDSLKVFMCEIWLMV